MIEFRNCDHCPDDSQRQARREFAHLFVGDSYVWAPGVWDTQNPFNGAYGKRIAELRLANRKNCWYWLADCGGDSLSLCVDCLKVIVTELEGAVSER